MANTPNIIILAGPPAAGKTTLSGWITPERPRKFTMVEIENATTFGTPGRTYCFDGVVLRDAVHLRACFEQLRAHEECRYVLCSQGGAIAEWVYDYAFVWNINPVKP